jgi:uncharacterized protein (DUF2267 family)
MGYEEFLLAVQERAGLPGERETLIAVEATLKTLGERLSETDAARLAGQLPPDIGRFITVVDMNKPYDLPAFYSHIASRARVDMDTARNHARAVLSVVREVVDEGSLRGAFDHLPEGFQALFA